MNNVPLAWIEAYNQGYNDCLAKFVDTHPVKELTDEEIIGVHINTPFIDGYLNKNLIDFARAILRKAQEK
jgi:hypothetical protein